MERMTATFESFVEQWREGKILHRVDQVAERVPALYRATASLLILAAHLALCLMPVTALYLASRLYLVWTGNLGWFPGTDILACAAAITLGVISLELFLLRFPIPDGVPLPENNGRPLAELVHRRLQAFKIPSVRAICLTERWEFRLTDVPRNGFMLRSDLCIQVGAPVLFFLDRDDFRVFSRSVIGQFSGEKDADAAGLARHLARWTRLHEALGSTLISRHTLRPILGAYVRLLSRLCREAVHTHHLDRERYMVDVSDDNAALRILAMEAVGQRFMERQYWPTLLRIAERNAKPAVRPFSNFEPLLRQLLPQREGERALLKELARQDCEAASQPTLRERVEELGYHHLGFPGLPAQSAVYDYLGGDLAALLGRLDRHWVDAHQEEWEATHRRYQEERKRFQRLQASARHGALEGDAALRFVEMGQRYLSEEDFARRCETILAEWPTPPRLLYKVGKALLSQGHPAGLQALEQAMKTDPSYIQKASALLEQYRQRQRRAFSRGSRPSTTTGKAA